MKSLIVYTIGTGKTVKYGKSCYVKVLIIVVYCYSSFMLATTINVC